MDLPRALPADDLAARWRAGRPGGPAPVVAADPVAALDQALAGAAGPIVVAGSLYLVGAVRARLVDDPVLRDPIDEAHDPRPSAMTADRRRPIEPTRSARRPSPGARGRS